LLAATAARADDAPVRIVVGTAQGEAGPGVTLSGDGTGTLTLPGTISEVQPSAVDSVGRVALINDLGAVAKQSKYWLGLQASPPSPALQAQLKLPKDQGLLVEALQPESPAAKAGLQQYDILLKGNGKPVANLGDLVNLLDQVKDGKLTFDLLRAGKHETVTVTPTKRPAHEPSVIGGMWIPNPQGPATAGFGRIGANVAEGGPLEFRVVRQGQILPPGAPMMGLPGGGSATMEIIVHAKATLPDGSKVEIYRHGAEPAKVTVTRDKEKWEGTANDLSKIPEKIRPEVEKLLHPAFDNLQVLATTGGPGGGVAGPMMAPGAGPKIIVAGPGAPGGGNVTYFGGGLAPPGLPGHFAVSPDVERRLGEMQKQIDELRRSVDALQSKAKKKAAPKPE
jgi:hypothetical protein